MAAAHLKGGGLTILGRNVRFGDGEIDLVAKDGPVVVFVEVRRRKGGEPGLAAASITSRKRTRIVHAARLWLARHPGEAGRTVRFDVIAIEGDPPAVEWIRGAFDAV